jgi:hypothetical protein
MKTNKLIGLVSAFITSMGALLFIAAPHAFAATKTWVGTDCPATNCNWSNVNNWVGGVVPVNGDDIVINASAVTPSNAASTTDDIAALNVASISTSGYQNSVAGGPYRMSINLSQNLIISGNVTHTVAVAAAPAGWSKASFLGLGSGLNAITLGANSTMQNAQITATTLTLGGHTLDYKLDSNYTGTTYNVVGQITGAGTFTIDLPLTVVMFMDATNNYSGTTNINTVDYVSSLGDSTKVFGTSTINISSQSRILFEPKVAGAVTIANPINVTAPTVTGSFLSNQIEFWSGGGANAYTVPNITLLGNARFGVNDISGAVSVNLAGIIANGHCIQYDTDNGKAANFSNGPAACVVAVAAGKAAPNTGFASIGSNPVVILGASFIGATALLVLARKTAKSTAKK